MCHKRGSDFIEIPVHNLISQSEESRDLFHHVRQIQSETFDMIRIEQGIPFYGKEITDQVNPLEAGLNRFVSFTKGCYIGQEVIARLDTYAKLQKKLIGIIFDPLTKSVPSIGKILMEGKEVGFTSSHTWSMGLHKHIALGYVRTNMKSDNIEFRDELTGRSIPARLSQLPYIQ